MKRATHDAKDRRRLSSRSAEAVRQVRAWGHRPAGFPKGASQYVVAGVTAEALLASLAPTFAEAQQVQPKDARIVASYEEFASPEGYEKGRGYLVKPANAKGKLPTVLVVHENRGLNSHIEDIARRLALDNFIAFAPDALFPLGGYPGDEDKARELFPKLDQAKTRNDFLAAEAWLKKVPGGNGKVGVVGFCYGGGISNFLATRVPDLGAAVPFYGAQPAAEDVPKIKAPLLIQYAGTDERINAGWPAYEAGAARQRRCATRRSSIPASSTASTTTRRRVTTKRPQSWPGSGRSTSSRRI